MARSAAACIHLFSGLSRFIIFDFNRALSYVGKTRCNAPREAEV
jgi:hypothetical protein